MHTRVARMRILYVENHSVFADSVTQHNFDQIQSVIEKVVERPSNRSE